jgi:hypothetical protein
LKSALSGCHDRVVAAGGVLIEPGLDFKNPERQQFAQAGKAGKSRNPEKIR